MLSKFSVKKPYTVVVAVVMVLILGFVAFTEMTADLLPSMNLSYVMVMTSYPGASPEKVETAVTKPVEQAMATVSNVKKVNSKSSSNMSTVMLEFSESADMNAVSLEIKESLDQVSAYWDDAIATPVIMKMNPDMMPVMVAAAGIKNMDSAKVTDKIKKDVVSDLESTEGVASVTTSGEVKESVQVILKQEKIDELNNKVKQSLDEKFAEAESGIKSAKSELTSNKNKLNSGQQEAADKLSQAKGEIQDGQNQISAGELEINSQLAQLEKSEAELASKEAELLPELTAKEAELTTQENELSSQKNTLETQIGAMEKQLEGMSDKTDAAALALAQQIEAGKAALEQVKTGLSAIADGKKEIADAKAQFGEGYTQIREGREKLNEMKGQLSSGKMTTKQAMQELDKQQFLATIQMSTASAGITSGETQISQKEEELKTTKEKAYESADLKNILTSDMVKNILKAQNFSMPAGYVTEKGIDYLVRVGEQAENLKSMKNIVLVNMEGIDPIKLSDVAEVSVIDDSKDVYAKLNDTDGIVLSIQKQTGYSTGEVTKNLKEKFKELKANDKDLMISVLMDQGVYIDLVVNSVLQNLIFGAVLAVLVLLLFLRSFRSTLIIACSIPISILSAIVLMYFSGVTINIISLSGLALGVGMLVDNSIVVIENISRMRNEGATASDAAIRGAKQVAGAITASTLTTVCVFSPIVFTKGLTRQLFVDMGLTIAYSLAASLAVALTLVPAMSAGLLKKTEVKDYSLFEKIRNGYCRILRLALKWKAVTLSAAVVLLIVSVIAAASNGTGFMPEMESTQMSLTLTTKKGTTVEDTGKVADKVIQKIRKNPDVTDVGAMTGGSSMTGETKTNEVSMYILLKTDKKHTGKEIKKSILKETKGLPCELSIETSTMDMSALGGTGISLQVKGKNLDKLQKIAKDVAGILKKVKGTSDVSDGLEEVKEELRVAVDESKAMEHNLTTAQVYEQISSKVAKAQSATTMTTDTKDYEVFVEDGTNLKLSREDIKNMKIKADKTDGTKEEIALADIAKFEKGTSPSSISRESQTRYINVSAAIDDFSNVGTVSNKVTKELKKYKVPDGYTVEMTGEDKSINDAMAQVLKMMLLAVVFMYLIMVAQFQSLLSPFIIMFTIPLAFTGGFFGLFFAGAEVSVIAMIGFVMLAGVIVNNGIVFVDYTNQLRKEGMDKKEALVEAGRTRLRPIVMTALTTILGLSTMTVGMGMGADMIQPMAIVTVGGLLYGTLLTLVVVPCIYDLLNRKDYTKEAKRVTEED